MYKKLSIILLCLASLTVTNAQEKKKPVENWEKTLLEEVNKLRAKGCRCPNGKYYRASQPLTWNTTLAITARLHAEDMDKYAYFEHKGKDGRGFAQRITDSGYQWKFAGENIAWGFSDPKKVVRAWRRSKGHCRNMMNPNYTEMGAGISEDFWVQDLASPK